MSRTKILDENFNEVQETEKPYNFEIDLTRRESIDFDRLCKRYKHDDT